MSQVIRFTSAVSIRPTFTHQSLHLFIYFIDHFFYFFLFSIFSNIHILPPMLPEIALHSIIQSLLLYSIISPLQKFYLTFPISVYLPLSRPFLSLPQFISSPHQRMGVCVRLCGSVPGKEEEEKIPIVNKVPILSTLPLYLSFSLSLSLSLYSLSLSCLSPWCWLEIGASCLALSRLSLLLLLLLLYVHYCCLVCMYVCMLHVCNILVCMGFFFFFFFF